MTLESPLRERLRAALGAALKERDTIALGALRPTLAAIDNAQAVHPPPAPTLGGAPIAGAVMGLGAGEATRRELTEEQISDIVLAEIAERHSAAQSYARAGRHEQAARLRAEADVLTAQLGPP